MIQEITENKKDFIELLLLADEQESMVDIYLEKGEMFAFYDNGVVVGECVVSLEDDFVELKNIAVEPKFQRMGYGKKLVEFVADRYKFHYTKLFVGTGDSDLTIPFYESCGFLKSHVVKNFFTDNYDHPIFENGKQLVDMIYLKREL